MGAAQRRTGALAVAGLLLGACTGATATRPGAGPPATLASFPEAERQIRTYYASQGAGEPAAGCARGAIESIDGSRVVADTAIELVVEVTYRFRGTSLAGAPCAGTGRRWFVFDRESDGRLALAEMADTAP